MALLIASIGCGSKLNRRGKPQVLVHVSTYQGNPFWHGFFLSEAADCQDKVPPFPSPEAMSIIRSELGQDATKKATPLGWIQLRPLCGKRDGWRVGFVGGLVWLAGLVGWLVDWGRGFASILVAGSLRS